MRPIERVESDFPELSVLLLRLLQWMRLVFHFGKTDSSAWLLPIVCAKLFARVNLPVDSFTAGELKACSTRSGDNREQ